MIVSKLLKTFAFETKVLLVDVKHNETHSMDTKRYFNEYEYEPRWDGKVAISRVTDGKVVIFYKSGTGL